MKNNVLKQMGWRDGVRYVGNVMNYASMCYETFDDFTSQEDFDIMDEYMDKSEPYQNDGRYIILNRALADYVRDVPVGHTIKHVRLPDRSSFIAEIYRDRISDHHQFKFVDTIMFRPDRMDDVTTHLTYQMKRIRETLSQNKTSVL